MKICVIYVYTYRGYSGVDKAESSVRWKNHTYNSGGIKRT